MVSVGWLIACVSAVCLHVNYVNVAMISEQEEEADSETALHREYEVAFVLVRVVGSVGGEEQGSGEGINVWVSDGQEQFCAEGHGLDGEVESRVCGSEQSRVGSCRGGHR